MVILHLTFDKITQHQYLASIVHKNNYRSIGTESTALKNSKLLDERIEFIRRHDEKHIIVWNKLERSSFRVKNDFAPQPRFDYPQQLHDVADIIVYAPSLIMMTHGNKPVVLKGDEQLAISIFPELKEG